MTGRKKPDCFSEFTRQETTLGRLFRTRNHDLDVFLLEFKVSYSGKEGHSAEKIYLDKNSGGPLGLDY